MHWETHVRRSRFQGRWWRRRYKGDKEKQCDTSLEDIHRSMMGTHVTIVTDLSSKIWIYLNVFNAMAQCLSARYLNELWKSLKRWRRPVAPSRWTYVHTYIYIIFIYMYQALLHDFHPGRFHISIVQHQITSYMYYAVLLRPEAVKAREPWNHFMSACVFWKAWSVCTTSIYYWYY